MDEEEERADLRVDVGAVALEILGGLHADEHVKVTGRTSFGASIALFPNSQPAAAIDPGRDGYHQLLRFLNAAAAGARPAIFVDDLTRPLPQYKKLVSSSQGACIRKIRQVSTSYRQH